MTTEKDANVITQGDNVRFTPNGLDRDSRDGEVFAVHNTEIFGTIFHIRDESGNRYQLGPGAIDHD